MAERTAPPAKVITHEVPTGRVRCVPLSSLRKKENYRCGDLVSSQGFDGAPAANEEMVPVEEYLVVRHAYVPERDPGLRRPIESIRYGIGRLALLMAGLTKYKTRGDCIANEIVAARVGLVQQLLEKGCAPELIAQESHNGTSGIPGVSLKVRQILPADPSSPCRRGGKRCGGCVLNQLPRSDS